MLGNDAVTTKVLEANQLTENAKKKQTFSINRLTHSNKTQVNKKLADGSSTSVESSEYEVIDKQFLSWIFFTETAQLFVI